MQALSDEELLPRKWFRRERQESQVLEMGLARNGPLPYRMINEEPPTPIRNRRPERKPWHHLSTQTRSIIFAWIFGFLCFLAFGANSYSVQGYSSDILTAAVDISGRYGWDCMSSPLGRYLFDIYIFPEQVGKRFHQHKNRSRIAVMAPTGVGLVWFYRICLFW